MNGVAFNENLVENLLQNFLRKCTEIIPNDGLKVQFFWSLLWHYKIGKMLLYKNEAMVQNMFFSSFNCDFFFFFLLRISTLFSDLCGEKVRILRLQSEFKGKNNILYGGPNPLP